MTRVGVWDGWRGMAIFLVLNGHFFDTAWVWEERMGVDIFFALSGTLMAMILFEDRISLKDFYIRRFSRVYPAFAVFVSVVFAFALLQQEVGAGLIEYLSTLTFLRTYLPQDPNIWESGVIIGHLWSLNVEEHAYLIMSLFSLAFLSRTTNAMLLLVITVLLTALAVMAIQELNTADAKYYLATTHGTLPFIFFSAVYGVFKRQCAWQVPGFVPLVCVLLAFICYIESMPDWLHVVISPVLLGIAVNHLDESYFFVKRLLMAWPLQKLGMLSFSVYLWQQVFYVYAHALPVSFITGPALSVMFGLLSFYIIEQPCRNFINNRWSAKPSYRPQA